QWVRADFYNPASQLIIKITDPVVKPLRRIIPGFAGIDMATLLLAFLVVVLKNILLLQQLNPLAIGLLSLGDTLTLIVNIFMYAIIIQAVLSWVNPDPYHPMMSLLNSLTNPILKHVRNIIPPISGIDLSSLFAIIGLMVIVQSINYLLPMLFEVLV
ncbi:Cell division integral membrane protein, YggT and half-length relatives, partial [hydrothermal vent metagenome]